MFAFVCAASCSIRRAAVPAMPPMKYSSPLRRTGSADALLIRAVRLEHVLQQGLQLAEVLARCGVDDNGSLPAGTLDFAYAVPAPFESPPGLRRAKTHVESIALDLFHEIS